jgi:hypothetical protein
VVGCIHRKLSLTLPWNRGSLPRKFPRFRSRGMNSWGCFLQCPFRAAGNLCFSVLANVPLQLTRYKITTNVSQSGHCVRVTTTTGLESMTNSDLLRRSRLGAPTMPSNHTKITCSCRVQKRWVVKLQAGHAIGASIQMPLPSFGNTMVGIDWNSHNPVFTRRKYSCIFVVEI